MVGTPPITSSGGPERLGAAHTQMRCRSSGGGWTDGGWGAPRVLCVPRCGVCVYIYMALDRGDILVCLFPSVEPSSVIVVGFKEQDGGIVTPARRGKRRQGQRKGGHCTASDDTDSGRAATARQAATSTEEGRRRRGERALGKEDRTGFTGTSLLIIGGGVSWDYPPGRSPELA